MLAKVLLAGDSKNYADLFERLFLMGAFDRFKFPAWYIELDQMVKSQFAWKNSGAVNTKAEAILREKPVRKRETTSKVVSPSKKSRF